MGGAGQPMPPQLYASSGQRVAEAEFLRELLPGNLLAGWHSEGDAWHEWLLLYATQPGQWTVADDD
eukprot:443564-Lingulodinium_polyedra.AAC.1